MNSFKYTKFPLNTDSIKKISAIKGEPDWVLEIRLKAYESFLTKQNPSWGINLSDINLENINYYLTEKLKEKNNKNQIHDSLSNEQVEEFNSIGVPLEERDELSGISRQYNSEMVYNNLKSVLQSKGVIFCSIEDGIKKYPEYVKKYLTSVIGIGDNKYSDLNTAFFSGGSFVYIPKDIKLELPLETYFRINAKEFGQFERTLIIAQSNSSVHYIEGCTAPQYTQNNLHCGVVEIVANEGSNVTYTTLQNWSKNVYNLVTKRAIAKKDSHISWVDCNIGSAVTMKYPAVILEGDNSSGELLSLSLATNTQRLDTGGKMIHIGKNTKSIIRSKGIVSNGGLNNYRGLVKILKSAENSKSYIECDSLILDEVSQSNTYPQDYINNSSSYIEHEAYMSSISKDKIDYLMSKGLSEIQARDIVIQGFSSNIVNLLPSEYNIELKKILFNFSNTKG